jgi:hypothetical protein
MASMTRTILTATSTQFRIHAAVDAYEAEDRIFSRNWDETIARDNM